MPEEFHDLNFMKKFRWEFSMRAMTLLGKEMWPRQHRFSTEKKLKIFSKEILKIFSTEILKVFLTDVLKIKAGKEGFQQKYSKYNSDNI